MEKQIELLLKVFENKDASLNETKDALLNLLKVMDWVATKDELPPLHKYVLLYKISNDEHKVEFIHEFDLTTDRYTRNWTHWKLVEPPCA